MLSCSESTSLNNRHFRVLSSVQLRSILYRLLEDRSWTEFIICIDCTTVKVFFIITQCTHTQRQLNMVKSTDAGGGGGSECYYTCIELFCTISCSDGL